MNETIKAGEVFKLSELVTYADMARTSTWMWCIKTK